MTRVSVAIQHHPSRAPLIPDLLGRLEGLNVEVVEDPDPTGKPDPWRCYRECLERTPGWATHRVILQDDVVPCDGFAAAVVGAIAAKPDRPVAFWVGGQPADACGAMRKARLAGKHWVDLSPWLWFPCVAAAWPAELVTRMLDWLDVSKARVSRADDAVTAKFLQAHRIWPAATVPCLVEHPDVVLSVIGRKAWAGRDKGRVACIQAVMGELPGIVW